MSRPAHWAVEYNEDNDPHATPCDCHVGEDHDDTRPVTPAELLNRVDPTASLLPGVVTR
ncbi:MAG: hypothetical protein ACREQ5_00360 [Candidatus Dormibacteria bacterium]